RRPPPGERPGRGTWRSSTRTWAPTSRARAITSVRSRSPRSGSRTSARRRSSRSSACATPSSWSARGSHGSSPARSARSRAPAASTLARDRGLAWFERADAETGERLPRGAFDPAILEVARRLHAKGGRDLLGRYAKLHFRTTGTALGPGPGLGGPAAARGEDE